MVERNFYSKILTLITIFFIYFSSYPVQKSYGDVEIDEVVRVYDGDTFTVNIKDFPDIIGKEINIRIDGIDTPEIRDKNSDIKQLAEFARETLENILMKLDKITLKDIKRDKYFRIVAKVFVNDTIDVSKFLLEEKLAKPYSGGRKDPWTEEDVDAFWNRLKGEKKIFESVLESKKVDSDEQIDHSKENK